MGLLLGLGAVLDAPRDHEQLPRVEIDVPVAELNGQTSLQDEEEVIGVVVLVPDELPLQLHDLDVVVVELRDDLRAPVLREGAELRGEGWSVGLDRNAPSAAQVVHATNGVAPQAAQKPAPAKKKKAVPKGTPVSSPMTGIYYSAPSPGAPPFCKVGEAVNAGQVVGLIEAMKVFNEITAPVSGTVTALKADNGQLVQPGDPLIYIG